MSLKQRVPLTNDKQGNPLFITIDWLKDLQALDGASNADGTVTQAEFDALQAQVNSYEATINALLQANTDLAARVRKLEGGYQS